MNIEVIENYDKEEYLYGVCPNNHRIGNGTEVNFSDVCKICGEGVVSTIQRMILPGDIEQFKYMWGSRGNG